MAVFISLLVIIGFGIVEVSKPNIPTAPAVEPAVSVEGIRSKLDEHIRLAAAEHDYVLPPKNLYDLLLSIGEDIYNHPHEPPAQVIAPPPLPGTPEYSTWHHWQKLWARRHEFLFDAVAQSLVGYVKNFPYTPPAPFKKQFEPSPNLFCEMTQPFRAEHMRQLGLGQWILERYNANVGVMSEYGEPSAQPQRYQGPAEAMAQAYFGGTPFLPLLQTLIPFRPFTNEQRFTHHWCLGDTGTGKTTYLRHFIKDDLEHAIKSECSLIVMDSKKLIREMRHMSVFAPGHPLDGCMTLIDAETPFPLNPFHLPKKQAIAVVSYMIAGLGEASKLQTGVLKWYAEAAYHTGKSLHKVLEYMQWDGKAPLPDMDRFPEDVRTWFQKTRKGVHSQTSSGIEQRLADFLRDHKDTLVPMFNADSWGLDFGELDKPGRVLLVDTNRATFGKDGANLLGRLVIGLIDDLSSRRTPRDETTLKPLWVVIDEAQDYIKTDEIFADILEKSRSQRIGITVAHHHKGQIDQRIEQSLENSGLKSECKDVGTVHIKTRKAEFELTVRKLDFTDTMTPEEYKQMRAEMANLYPYKHTPKQENIITMPLTQKF